MKWMIVRFRNFNENENENSKLVSYNDDNRPGDGLREGDTIKRTRRDKTNKQRIIT